MRRVSLAEAKDNLSELVEEAAAGEPVDIIVGGKVVARISAPHLTSEPSASTLSPIDALRQMTSKLTFQQESAGDFVRRMRDEDRY